MPILGENALHSHGNIFAIRLDSFQEGLGRSSVVFVKDNGALLV